MTEVVVLGGSAGSLPLIISVLRVLPPGFDFTVIIVVHRLRNVASAMESILAAGNTELNVREPEDKEPIKKGMVYLAPQNYHLQIEEDKTFSLDYSEAINYSRPSIDVTFDCVAAVYGQKAVGILLSGANDDGAAGLSAIIKKGGTGIVQDPSTTDYATMPNAAIAVNGKVLIREPEDIIRYVSAL
jgi:two-component system chemotaxis response regulator CheB